MAKSLRSRHQHRLVNPCAVDGDRRRAPGGVAAAGAVLAGAAGLVVLGAGTASAAPVLDDDTTGAGSSSSEFGAPLDIGFGPGSSDPLASIGSDYDVDVASFEGSLFDEPSLDLAPVLVDPTPPPEPEPDSIPEPAALTEPVARPAPDFETSSDAVVPRLAPTSLFASEFEPATQVMASEPQASALTEVTDLPETPVLLADARLPVVADPLYAGVDGSPVAVTPVVDTAGSQLQFGLGDPVTTATFDEALSTARATTPSRDEWAWQFGADAVGAFDPAADGIDAVLRRGVPGHRLLRRLRRFRVLILRTPFECR